jgi:hypothetical protein
MLARVDAAADDRGALAAVYADLIGHDPFADVPAPDAGEVHDTLRDYVREVSASFGVHWADVDPLAGAPELPAWSPAG